MIDSILALAAAMDRNTAALERSNDLAEQDSGETIVTMDD